MQHDLRDRINSYANFTNFNATYRDAAMIRTELHAILGKVSHSFIPAIGDSPDFDECYTCGLTKEDGDHATN